MPYLEKWPPMKSPPSAPHDRLRLVAMGRGGPLKAALGGLALLVLNYAMSALDESVRTRTPTTLTTSASLPPQQPSPLRQQPSPLRQQPSPFRQQPSPPRQQHSLLRALAHMLLSACALATLHSLRRTPATHSLRRGASPRSSFVFQHLTLWRVAPA